MGKERSACGQARYTEKSILKLCGNSQECLIQHDLVTSAGSLGVVDKENGEIKNNLQDSG